MLPVSAYDTERKTIQLRRLPHRKLDLKYRTENSADARLGYAAISAIGVGDGQVARKQKLCRQLTASLNQSVRM